MHGGSVTRRRRIQSTKSRVPFVVLGIFLLTGQMWLSSRVRLRTTEYNDTAYLCLFWMWCFEAVLINSAELFSYALPTLFSNYISWISLAVDMLNAHSKLLLLIKDLSTLPTLSTGLLWTNIIWWIFRVIPLFSNSSCLVWTGLHCSKRFNRHFLVQWEEVFYLTVV